MLATGVTYRQLDYWTRKGILTPEAATPGSGYARRWSPADLTRVRMLLALTSIGLALSEAVEWVDDAFTQPDESPLHVIEADTPTGLLTIVWRLDEHEEEADTPETTMEGPFDDGTT